MKDVEEEISFEIPENWCWCRIKEIMNLQAGKNIVASQISSSLENRKMRVAYIDESGETCYRSKDNNQIFGLGSLIVEDNELLEDLFNKLAPYLINGEFKF